mmetsp:Transcript_21369/g.48542  ORF Transcript_21369/g.48542 Transcript_21369/m.48542 type:complete len:206 (-) Transcript_21369:291-908(-)
MFYKSIGNGLSYIRSHIWSEPRPIVVHLIEYRDQRIKRKCVQTGNVERRISPLRPKFTGRICIESTMPLPRGNVGTTDSSSIFLCHRLLRRYRRCRLPLQTRPHLLQRLSFHFGRQIVQGVSGGRFRRTFHFRLALSPRLFSSGDHPSRYRKRTAPGVVVRCLVDVVLLLFLLSTAAAPVVSSPLRPPPFGRPGYHGRGVSERRG